MMTTPFAVKIKAEPLKESLRQLGRLRETRRFPPSLRKEFGFIENT
jgi:hypothetical protein